MTTGIIVLVVALLLAGGFGLLRRRTDGRFADSAPRTTDSVGTADASAAESETPGVPAALGEALDSSGASLGGRATLVQFSSAFCAPCRATRVVLGDVAAAYDDVVHVELDAESHLDLVRDLGVMRTPTTLVLDSRGREVTRASGAPTREQVEEALSLASAA